MRVKRNVLLWVLALAAAALAGAHLVAVGGPTVGEKRLLDNDRVAVYEVAFPPGFRGDEHAAIADEFAYVLDGALGVVARGGARRVVRQGEIEYAAKGTIHYSVNESKKPARVLVVLVKEH